MKKDVPIKLFKLDEMEDGTVRLQTQLSAGRNNVADFILKDGVLSCWGNGAKGFNFYPYTKPYQVVTDIKEMQYQQL